MALNQNHTIEELGGTRCAIVEKNISQARVDFLTTLLTGNGFTVVCVEAPSTSSGASAKKLAPPSTGSGGSATPVAEAKASGDAETATLVPEPVEGPKLFTLGVTNLMFNPINAVFGRLLKSSNGHFVTPAYWHQEEALSHDEIPYYEHRL